jgi:hypothetical protein
VSSGLFHWRRWASQYSAGKQSSASLPNKRAGTLASQQGMDWAPSASQRGRDWCRWASQYSTGEQSSASLRRRDWQGCASEQTHRPTGGIGHRGPASEEGTRDDGPASAAQSSRHGPACGARDQQGWVSQSRTSKQVHLPTSGIWYHGPPSEDGTREDGVEYSVCHYISSK